MTYGEFTEELKIAGKVIAITRINCASAEKIAGGCSLAALNAAIGGKTVYITSENMRCAGAAAGFGLRDGMPEVAGGFGHFISSGQGKGFPDGERVKKTPELAEKMFFSQPQDVMGGFNAIKISQYQEEETPDTVAVLANPDQLSALIHIFNYEKADYDNVIIPMSSGCSSVFRIPFGELKKGGAARAVVGNADVYSRPHFPADTFFFTVSGSAFKRMIEVAGESVLVSPIWRGVKKRLFN